MEADGEVSLKTFRSPYVPTLGDENDAKGKLPEELLKALADSGVEVAQDTETMTIVKGFKWGFTGSDGMQYFLKLEPQFWEPNVTFDSIRFIKRLDHFWLYR